jgi:hypothetical protein
MLISRIHVRGHRSGCAASTAAHACVCIVFDWGLFGCLVSAWVASS